MVSCFQDVKNPQNKTFLRRDLPCGLLENHSCSALTTCHWKRALIGDQAVVVSLKEGEAEVDYQ
jgi:hypothetical protein